MTDDIETVLDEYSPLVYKIARSACFSSAAIDLSDLIQVGEIAVLEALRRYDPSCGATIKSYIARLVRQAIYREAARFLGVFTVDHRVTSLAARASRLYAEGHSDTEIADIINKGNRNFDADHIRDLRLAYSRRQHTHVNDDDSLDENDTDERTIQELLKGVVQGKEDEVILNQRILGNASVNDISAILQVSLNCVYDLERSLKERIRRAIKDFTE